MMGHKETGKPSSCQELTNLVDCRMTCNNTPTHELEENRQEPARTKGLVVAAKRAAGHPQKQQPQSLPARAILMP